MVSSKKKSKQSTNNKNYRLFLKKYINNRPLLFIFLSFLVVLLYLMTNNLIHGPYSNIFFSLEMCEKISLFSFVLFSFNAYEFSYSIKKANINEYLHVGSKAFYKIVFNHIMINIIQLSIFFCIMLTWHILILFQYRIFDTVFLKKLVLELLLNYLIIPYTGIIFGTFLSLHFGRVISLFCLTVFSILGSSLSNSIGIIIFDQFNIDVYPVLNIFDIFPPNQGWTPIPAFGHSILPYRWEFTLFWNGLFTGGIFWLICKRRKIIPLKPFCCFFLSLLFLCFAIQPSSKLLLTSDSPKESIMADQIYYYSPNESIDISQSKPFHINEYKLDLRIKNKLFAKAHLYITEQNLDTYDFTLYHGYRVNRIIANNEVDLPYIQAGDYIFVDNSNNNRIQEITIEYSGSSPIYYSNQQGVFLPGYFPYYPHSGQLQVFNTELMGFEQSKLDTPTRFTINISHANKIYCNLNNNGDSFTGVTDGVTILAGNYKSIDVNNVSVVYPFLDNQFAESKIVDFVYQNQGHRSFPNTIKKILITPGINNLSPYTYYCQFSDSITIQQLLNFDNAYKEQAVNSEKYVLYNAYLIYCQDPNKFKESLLKMKNDATEYNPSARDYLLEYIEYYGEKEGLKKLKEYFENNSDHTPWQVFVDER